MLEADRLGSPNVEPAHGGLQEMIVIARHGLVHEGNDLVVGEPGAPSGFATSAEDDESVAVMAVQRDGDVRVSWCHFVRLH